MKTVCYKTEQKHIKYSYQSQIQKDYNLEHMQDQLCKIGLNSFPNNFLTIWGFNFSYT